MTMEPEDLTFQLLQEITDDFSEERRIGAGSYGDVYKGVTKNGEDVAVKMLKENLQLDDQQFANEFRNLKMLKHQNIVQILGYCYETKKTPIKYNGKTVIAEKTYRALCFEYLHNGSLEKHLSDEFHGFDWHTRYRIIKGTCEGLKHIHEELAEPLYHLDLKPENILLDKNMVPKIADFGLSRFFGKELARTTRSPVGTLGYQPPEYIERGEISKRFDIYSFGVMMIKVLAGYEGYSNCAYMQNDGFIDLVQTNWRNRLQTTWSGSLLEAYCHQVKICTQMALNCVKEDSQERPDIVNIIDALNEIERDIGENILLQVEPIKLQFPEEADSSEIACSLQLTNNTDNHVVFRLVTKNPECFKGSFCGVVTRGEKYSLTVTRCNKLLKPQVDRDEYLTLESSMASDHEIQYTISDHVDSYTRFFVEAIETGREIHRVKLTVSYIQAQGKTPTKFPHRSYSKTVSGMTMDNTEVPDQLQNFNLMASARCNDLEFPDIRETASDVGAELIVGRTKEKVKIMASLLDSMEHKIILPIYGIGGIGKTTFAKLIYNNFESYSRAWVYVSSKFDLNMIGNSIISQLSKKESLIYDRKEIRSCLMKLLSDKKILIVLDDLWEENPFQLEDLKDMLNLGESIKRIVLVTTRSKPIAKKICTNHKPYKIESLSNDMCWDIIKQRSGFEFRYDKGYLEGIGREISKKCGGIALAAQSLGFMLQSKTTDQWIEVKDSDIWNNSISNVLASLKLSYSSMPPCLKSCFTYCSMFQKGHKIAKNDLIHQWISLGFIKRTKLLSTMQLCEKYIVQLVGLSFLQHSVSPMIVGAFDKGVTLFTMHDLVHDLAKSAMVDGILDTNEQSFTGEPSCCYKLLTDCSRPLESSTKYPEKIRALRFLDCGQIELHGSAFSPARSLLVLDLSDCHIHNLAASIGELVQLRYLKAPNIQSQMISDSITKLSKLIYLDLSGSKMSALPVSIGVIEGLMYLDISNCSQIKELPESFGNLKRLVHLDLSNCHKLGGVSKTLGGLTNVQYLNLSRQENIRNRAPLHWLPHIIGNFIELRYLGLSTIMYDVFPNQAKGDETETYGFIDRIATLSNLEHLDLSRNGRMNGLPESICRLRKLHTLDLSHCALLRWIPECMVKMDSLKILNVMGCPMLDKSPLPRLKKLALLPHVVVLADDGESSSNISVVRHANSPVLHISGLDNVKSSEEVERIKLIEKQGIYELKLEWTSDAPRSVEDIEVLGGLVPPTTLMYFHMKGYNSVSFPKWVLDITHYLSGLIEIEVWDLRKCSNLPPLGQLRNLQRLVMGRMDSITTIGNQCSLCGGPGAFPRLKKFSLCHMAELQVWNTICSYGDGADGKELMFPSLVELKIDDCPKLRIEPCPPRAMTWVIEKCDTVLSSWGEERKTLASSSAGPGLTDYVSVTVISSKVPLHEWRLFHHLPDITWLKITRCTDLTCDSLEIIRDPTLIKFLFLEGNHLPELPKWLGKLTSLRQLWICSCTGQLEVPPDNMKQLTSLHLLSLVDCTNLTTLPQSLGTLISHREFCIKKCAALSDLQESMRNLSFLERLWLEGCSSLSTLPEWLGDLAALEKLCIFDCKGATSFPDSIQKLTKLEVLKIIGCPELAEWCKLEENNKKLAHVKHKRTMDREEEGYFNIESDRLFDGGPVEETWIVNPMASDGGPTFTVRARWGTLEEAEDIEETYWAYEVLMEVMKAIVAQLPVVLPTPNNGDMQGTVVRRDATKMLVMETMKALVAKLPASIAHT